MAWKGEGNDSKIWWSSLHEGQWEAQQSVADGGVGTSHGPALAVVDGKLILAWKGKGNDSKLWWSVYSGAPPWSDQTQVTSRGGVGYETSHGPALASFRVFDL